MDADETTYTIGQVAKMLGCNASTIRYYDKLGLLPFVEKNESGGRTFSSFDVSWLQLIELFKLSGLRLDEIKQMLEWGLRFDETIEERLDMYKAAKDRIEEEIAQLETTRAIARFNIWYYERALEAGSLDAARSIPPESYPEDLREIAEKYHLVLKPSPFEKASSSNMHN